MFGVAEDMYFNLRKTLFFGTALLFFIWYTRNYWKHRRLYEMAATRPGPRAYPFIGNSLYFIGSPKDTLVNLIKIAHQYESPSVLWLGKRVQFYISLPRDMAIILNSPHALEKGNNYKHIMPYLGTGLLTAPVSQWKRNRKIINPTFSQKALDTFVQLFLEKSEILLKQLTSKVGNGIFDANNYLNRCTFDIICETTMGITVDAQTTNSDFLKWFKESFKIISKRMWVIWYRSDFIFNLILGNHQQFLIQSVQNFVDSVIDEKLRLYKVKSRENQEQSDAFIYEDKPARQQILFELIIQGSEKVSGNTRKQLREELTTFLAAGSETTAVSAGNLLLMLGLFPDIQEKVYEEVIGVIGSLKIFDAKDLGKLQYTERVMKETFRLFPSIPFTKRKITGDIKLEKCVIPAGCSVLIAIIGLHRNPSIWPQPLKFDPDRFLPEQSKERPPYSFLPFSGGPRNCIGSIYAMMTLKTILAMIVRKYRITTDYKSIEDIELTFDVTLRPIRGHRIGIQLR